TEVDSCDRHDAAAFELEANRAAEIQMPSIEGAVEPPFLEGGANVLSNLVAAAPDAGADCGRHCFAVPQLAQRIERSVHDSGGDAAPAAMDRGDRTLRREDERDAVCDQHQRGHACV